jgi:hypothetical protein
MSLAAKSAYFHEQVHHLSLLSGSWFLEAQKTVVALLIFVGLYHSHLTNIVFVIYRDFPLLNLKLDGFQGTGL